MRATVGTRSPTSSVGLIPSSTHARRSPLYEGNAAMSPAPQYRPSVSAVDFLTEAARLLSLREFEAPEPESLPGLVDRLPPGTPMPTILYRYHVRPKGGMQNKHLRPFIRCAHCQGKRHWKGFVIQLDDGSLALLGHNCGEDQFGIDFRRIEADFHTARNRQVDLRRLVELRALIPAFEHEFDFLAPPSFFS